MKINYCSIGCKVNQYECEALINKFLKNDFVLGDSYTDNDVFIVNTCSVTNTSEVKSRKAVRKVIKDNPKAVIAVMGCYSQINPEALEKIEGVDLIFGTSNRKEIFDKVLCVLNEKEFNKKNISEIDSFVKYENLEIDHYFNKTRAFIKIQDGCENFCSYCIIPYTRGRIKSRPIQNVIDEVKRLVDTGTKEIVLTGINLGCYGEDLSGESLEGLISKILDVVEGDFRIRISSIEVTKVTNSLINLIKKHSNKICNHLHIPIQSANDRVLSLMNRKYDFDFFQKKIKEIREIIPNINITTDVIVGFPTESQEEYLQTFSRINEILFGEMHIFIFSKRDGTSAALIEDDNDPVIVKSRSNKLIELSSKMALIYREKCVKGIFNVLIEKITDGLCVGHSENYLCIKFKDNNFKVNQIVKVKLTKPLYPVSIGEHYEIQ